MTSADTTAPELAAIISRFTLPTGWYWSNVTDLASTQPRSIQSGPFGSALLHSEFQDTGVLAIGIDNVLECAFSMGKQHRISLEKYEDLERFTARPLDVLITVMATVGRCCVVPAGVETAIITKHVYRISPHKLLLSPYFFMYVLSGAPAVSQQISSQIRGQTRPGINGTILKRLNIPVPPLPEQRRIVEAIETNFTKLDAAEATLKRIQANLKRYRASVLKAAVEGTLVPTEAELARQENRDYEPASVLLDRILNERRHRWEQAELAKLKAKGKPPKNDNWKKKYKHPTPPDTTNLPDLPEGWCWACLDQLLSSLRNGFSKAPREASSVAILRISAVRPLAVYLEDIRYLPEPFSDYEDYALQKGDLLFTRYNGNTSLVGVCGVVPYLTRPTIYPDKLIRGRLVESLMIPGFVEVAANTGVSRRHIELRTRTTAGQSGVSGGDLEVQPIPLAPLNEQVRIESEVSRLLTVSDSANAQTKVAVLRSARLRHSILKMAFEGNLVPQDPNDEPASVLLERIRAEREAMQAKQKKTRRPRKKAARTKSRKS